MDQIGSNYIKLDQTRSNKNKLFQIKSNWIKKDKIGSSRIKSYELVQINSYLFLDIQLDEKIKIESNIIGRLIDLSKLGGPTPALSFALLSLIIENLA